MQLNVLLPLALALAVPAVAQGDGRDIDDVKEPDKGAPMTSWTPGQQWWARGSRMSNHGYGEAAGRLVFADEIGDKLSELGRVSLIDACFQYQKPESSALLSWALCRDDVKAFDAKKLQAELTAEGLNDASQKRILGDASDVLANAKKIGDAVETAAKDDAGIQQVLKLVEQARTEWNAYLGKNKDAFARYLTLKDAVRSGKSNNKGFAGCYEATQPAFAKLVKATKFPWELPGDYLPGYIAQLTTSIESYITTASFAACAYSVHESGEALAAAALSQRAGVIRVGYRSLALAKALDPAFKPKFAERSLNFDSIRSSWKDDQIKMENVNDIAPIMTPVQGTVSKVKADGDVVHISFKGDSVDACLEWKTTNRIQSYAANGDPMYEKVCKKRGKVANQENDAQVSSKFATGIAPGTSVLIVFKFPVTVWKAKKFVAVLGQPGGLVK